MIKHKSVIIILSLMLIIVMILSITLIAPTEVKVDVIEVNNIIEKGKVSIVSGESAYYKSPMYRYSIITVGGEYLFNGIGLKTNNYKNIIIEATSNNYIMWDINIDNSRYIVIIDTFQGKQFYNLAKIMKWTIFGITAAILIVILVWYIIICYKIYRPFYRLDKFAESVSRGNFDEPLNMDRANSFGNFQEAFDLMRLNVKTARDNERKAEEDKKNVIIELSHDLKLPIASIIAIAECIELKGDDGKVNKIIKQAEQINSIVSDIYNSTLHDIGKLKVNIEEHSGSELSRIIAGTDYLNKIIMDTIPDVKLIYDPIRIKQIFDNVIGNSYKYANTDIILSASLDDKYLRITVIDHGCGVDDAEMAKLTDKFYRGDKVKNISGEGLGLYVARILIELQGGHMGIASINGLQVSIDILRADYNAD